MIYSVKIHTHAFSEILILQEAIRHLDTVKDEIKDIRDSKEVLDVIPNLEKLLIEQDDG